MKGTSHRIALRRALLAGAALVVTFGLSRSAFAAATLMTGLGGPVDFGSSCLASDDDGSWPPGMTGLDLTPAFPNGLHFYSGTYLTAWINNNGNISFNSAISSFTPDAFPGAPQPMIAPYWADVDTRPPGSCVGPTSLACGNPVTDGVWWSLTPGQFVVTWDQVGYYECRTTSVMSFQMILTAAPSCGASAGTDFNIEFRYSECGWEAGDASGGNGGFCPAGSVGTTCTPAQAGFDSAETPTDVDYASLPMSRMAGISTELCTGSNTMPAQAGVWQFLVRGGSVMCPAAGQACDTGKLGICSAGVTECTTGGTTCHQLSSAATTETCNGLDDNCNGQTDEGAVCPSGQVCNKGACGPTCSQGEFSQLCPASLTCSSAGVCVDSACKTVTCPAGEVCGAGTCKGPCVGITCPLSQVCRAGACVDPCAGLTCGTNQVCEKGVCLSSCSCAGCPTGESCESSGHCIETDCATVTCPAGEVCQAGKCTAACTGAVCPVGEQCKTGQCVADPVPDAGKPSGLGTLSGTDEGGADATTEGADAGAEAAEASDDTAYTGSHGTCSCSVPGDHRPASGGVAALGLGLAALVARRRKR